MADPYYSLCCEEIENLNHIFRSSPMADQFWRKMKGDAQVPGCLSSPFQEWLVLNLSKNKRPREDVDWKNKFAISLWWLWQWRNDRIFGHKVISVERKISLLHGYCKDCDALKPEGLLTNRQLAKNLWISSNPIPHYCVPFTRTHNLTRIGLYNR